MENFKTIPKSGDFVNILEHNGIIKISNTQNKCIKSYTHKIVDCIIKDNQICIKAYKPFYIYINKDIIDNGKDFVIYKDKNYYFNDILNICYNDNIVKNYYFKSLFGKIFNKTPIGYKYILGFDGICEQCRYLLKYEYWNYIEYQTTNFLLTYEKI